MTARVVPAGASLSQDVSKSGHIDVRNEADLGSFRNREFQNQGPTGEEARPQ